MSDRSGRLVITGAGGQLGSALAAQATAAGRDVLALTSSQWDITDAAVAERMGRSALKKNDVVVNCAAYTNVDGAESNELAAYAVNATGPEYIARACRCAGAALIHVSTDYVFSGDFGSGANRVAPRPYEPTDETGPLGVYGRSKLAGEQAVLAAMPEATVVRTAWVYTGGTGKDFVAVMRRLAAGDGPVYVVDDQIGSPTYVVDLAAALLQVADGSVHGSVLHAANEGEVSRFGQARAVFEECGADPLQVQPVSTAQNPRSAARPAYSALSGRQSVAAGLTPLRPWRSALVEALAVSRSLPVDRPLPSTRD
ncbi:dTDP-rhamnose modification protein [Mycobacterium leprae Kyoto-2]|uniref:dTDP-4-dehydrorhamnose reductase n=3 Tax=Mycobacterium leprae TaxID=1769 RepID=Q9CCK8_MYCLE|nr:dTDP-4-dehydrorhamnose reductase [Mycobacterium leprae]CAR70845.1 putative dTDP-rhamnose modification protein [Mycobacterium leprae Br4923]AWV48978.1 dTDP-4-dehydrorhamnose reductase [Mycobacterium leprae]OAR21764.1 dTDP-4-dehydrorhamnose reductase [Mycobacterium leprae 3125609]OAX72304.1 dTDP-4-dehydrorhamnose reductase [Mycobacterium leprae 7935681]CAC30260.1 putative dTDP-rhamnose modification protein [Mycobacterium leprae]